METLANIVCKISIVVKIKNKLSGNLYMANIVGESSFIVEIKKNCY